MESEEREQSLEEVEKEAEAGADRMEEQAEELGESIDDAREQWGAAQDQEGVPGAGPSPDDERVEEDPPAPAQEPPGDGD